ncbi:terminase large subunit [Clostridium saccharoperbutylacetonicum]|uniref:terminase large subunit n=1 Tax=Clostridium saccharoperbutylacetonicum TaxID=36745 RepID=UPI000983B11F|nr:terminase TerL endonuclease subunit [Clostridium saccharoperbutylacetonicum]AQR98124.1 phage terminase [Clostridium saccharoperbutylacetonicum]NSB34017.1 phage terminase large subunit-like protein [Clostridium saccharoperbutylacetonicum]
MTILEHPSYIYTLDVLSGRIKAPKYVIIQCNQFRLMAEGKSKKYTIDQEKVELIDDILDMLVMPKGLKAGQPIKNCVAGFQFFFIVAVLCAVHRDNLARRRYETAVLEICRKNGKTFLVGLIFILLFLLEPKYSKFYSVAPDGSLSREVKEAIQEIIGSSPVLENKFKIRRDDIFCKITDNKYVPLNYSNSRLDGKLPSVFLVDEVGALPNPYAVEAMRSGQLTILNKLGCIISTKYPTVDNPFEDEVGYCKKVLDGLVNDDTIFALLYEPDDVIHWTTNDEILEHGNPLALEVPEIMEDLKKKRGVAIEVPSKRENFITKHCNIIYQGLGTESYIDVNKLREGIVPKINWFGRKVWIGLDLALTNDNCSVGMVGEEDGDILAEAIAFIPEDRIEEKSKFEKIDYHEFVRTMKAIACGDMTVDYSVIEDFILNIESNYGVEVMGIGYDRYNCLSTAQKLNEGGYKVVEVRQHSSVLHPPTKLIKECIESNRFKYESNLLLKINFQNARVTEDTNLNKYVNKKKSNGKVDMVVSLINAVYLMQQDVIFNVGGDFVIQTV